MRSARLALLLVLIAMQSCVSLGSKTALVNRSHLGWKLDGREYRFDGKDIIVTVPEITLTERSRVIGFIVPVVPWNHEMSHADASLDVRATVLGPPSVLEAPDNSMVISAFVGGAPIEVLEKGAGSHSATHDGRVWRQYSVHGSYRIRLGSIQDLTLKFTFPAYATPIPDLELHRQEVSDNWIVLTPGP